MKHPYGHRTYQERLQHENGLAKAIIDADTYNDYYATHAARADGGFHGTNAIKAVAGHSMDPGQSSYDYVLPDDCDDDGDNYHGGEDYPVDETGHDGYKAGEDSSDDGRDLVEYYRATFAASQEEPHASSSGQDGHE